MRIKMLWNLPLLAGTIAGSSAVAQQASTTEWDAAPETPGDWTDATWTNDVPVDGSLAGILNGGTVGVTTATAVLKQLHVGGVSTLDIGALLTVEGVNADPDPTGFYVNEGTINVNAGGELRVQANGNFWLGREAAGNLNLLPGGSLTTNRLVNLGNGGPAAFGKLTLDGGTLNHTGGTFQVGPNNALGQLDILEGTATINNLRLNLGGSLNSQVNVVNQTGGDITYNGDTGIGWDTVGSATYNMSGGSITTTNRIRIGVSNKGDATRVNTFNHAGGDVDVTGRIDIGDGSPPEVVNIYDFSEGYLKTTSQILVGAHGTASGMLKLRGTSDVETPGIFIGNNATNTGTLTVEDEATAFVTDFEVRNGSVTQSGEDSQVDVTGRFYLGSSSGNLNNYSTSGTYTLTDGTLNLTSTNIRIGYRTIDNATLNIEGGILNTTSRLRVGVGEADGSLTPTNTVNQTGGDVFVIGRIDLGEFPGPTNIYQISGGILTATDLVMVGYGKDGTGTFTVSGSAEVDVPAMVMGENEGTNTTGTKGTVNLLGGTLTTGQIRVGNGLTADQTLILDGGTIRARTGGTTLIAGNVTTTQLLSGGVTFDTDGLNVSTAAVMTGPGGLTKTGAGTLTVNNVQAYTGDTTVEEGTLVLTQPYLADNGDVYLTTGAVLDLAHGVTDTIGTLYIDGEAQAAGSYGGADTGANTELEELMAGTGILNSVPSVVPSDPPVITSITVAGGVATIAITGAPNATYVCRFSDDLVTPFAPIATIPETVTTDGNGDATFTVDATVDKRFYVVGAEE